jgi:hypothetical protein
LSKKSLPEIELRHLLSAVDRIHYAVVIRPVDCLQYAFEAAQLASKTETRAEKENLYAMARAWLTLCTHIETYEEAQSNKDHRS